MKIHHVLLITAMAAITLCGDTMAQERLFGNGRFLRRLTGNTIAKPAPKAKAKTPKLADPKKASAKKPTSPTPAKDAIPTRAEAYNGSNSKSSRKEIGSGTARSETRPRTVLGSSKPVNVTKKSNKKSTLGFGMYIEDVKGKLVITDMDNQGNAVKEDLRKGDVLLGVGGVEITNLEEFNEITDILRDGDQIEMQFSRRGKELKKKIVQMGKTPKPPAAAPSQTPSLDNKIESLSNSSNGLQSVMSGTQSRAASSEVVRRQQQQIEQMQRELERLRRAPATQPRTGGSVLEGPSLSGPGL